MQGNWIDRAIGIFAPQAALRRIRARVATEVMAGFMARHYEAASAGRRTQGWSRSGGDANAVAGPALSRLRTAARDLVRNNGNAEGAVGTICDHVVGWGIVGKTSNRTAAAAWKAWAETTACDSDGRDNFYGLQDLAMRTVVESGEVLIRRRFRKPEDGLPIPLQIQVLEPDYIDTLRTGIRLPNGGRITHGIEFDVLGRRAAYWLFRDHPGSELAISSLSFRVPAASIIHIYRRDRPGQVRGASWFAPVLLKFKDHDEYEDATLMKQKVAACLAVITTDVDGSGASLGTADTSTPQIDSLEPGMILNVPPGRTIETVQPPSVREFGDYSKTTLRAIATGLGVSYEDLTGDYSNVNFSSARMSRIRHWARVERWRWRMLIPQMCDGVWSWAMEAAAIMGQADLALPVEWTAPPLPMVDPDKEGLAYMRLIRAGLMSRQEAVRERGYDPSAVMHEIASDNELADELGVILDSDPRNTTQQGNPRQTQAAGNVSTFEEPEPKEDAAPAKPEPDPADEDDQDDEQA
jgi:lambda family phage portal protein